MTALRAGIGQHLGGDIAGVGATRIGVAILAADANGRALRQIGKSGNQRGRRADQQIDARQSARALQHRAGIRRSRP